MFNKVKSFISVTLAAIAVMFTMSTPAQAFAELDYLGWEWDTYSYASTQNDSARFAATMVINMKYGTGSSASGIDPYNYANDVWLGASSTTADIQAELSYWGINTTVAQIDDFTVLRAGDIIEVPNGLGGKMYVTVLSDIARRAWDGKWYGRIYDPTWGSMFIGEFWTGWTTGNYYVKRL